jgi:hypothetical protein
MKELPANLIIGTETKAFMANHPNVPPAVLLQIYLVNPHPVSRDKIIQQWLALNKVSYDSNAALDTELLDQILSGDRLGRKVKPLPHKPPPKIEPKDHLVEHASSFSKNENLGSAIAEYFKNNPGNGLYEYAIFQDSTKPLKGIIIEYYGGFNDGFRGHSLLNLSNKDNLFLENGYRVIKLNTRDTWQSLQQKQQTTRTEAGRALLQDTVAALLLFTNTVKSKAPDVPIFYQGASFGGFKGALINLILSNKGHLAELFNDPAHASYFESLLTQVKDNLFQGFILHDGAYHCLFSMLRQVQSQLPLIILQNFDDERVTTDQALDFYHHLIADKSRPSKIKLFVTPQGAQTHRQVADLHREQLTSSTDGHFFPRDLQYAREYKKAILNFLEAPETTLHHGKHRDALNEMRYKHHQLLFNAKEPERTVLYRLYYANLHAESKSQNKTSRLQRTFSQYALMLSRDHADQSVETIYQRLVDDHGVWLLNQTFNKQKAMVAYTALFFKDIKPQPVMAIDPNVPKETLEAPTAPRPQQPKPTEGTDLYFYLTEEARAYLLGKTHALALIEHARQYAVVIDVDVLKFFDTHPGDLTHENIAELWECDHFPKATSIDLQKEWSRAFSIIEYTELGMGNKLFCLECLEYTKPWEPVLILLKFKNRNLSLANYKHLMTVLLQKNEVSRISIINNLFKIPLRWAVNESIDWVANLDDNLRDTTINNYILAVEVVDKMNLRSSVLDQLKMGTELQKLNPIQDYEGFVKYLQSLDVPHPDDSSGIEMDW